jgi:hypothetical protein
MTTTDESNKSIRLNKRREKNEIKIIEILRDKIGNIHRTRGI